MGRQKDRDRSKRQRRRKKLHELRVKLGEAVSPKERNKLIAKIEKLTVQPGGNLVQDE